MKFSISIEYYKRLLLNQVIFDTSVYQIHLPIPTQSMPVEYLSISDVGRTRWINLSVK